jgi:hypothetical protein
MEPPEEIWRMAFSRRLGVIGILGACWFVAVGCGDDDSKKADSTDGGEGGEAPSGGKATSGGSANNAGKGGSATAGKGGSGGATTAGTGGKGGSGGTAGGAAGTDAGNGGAAGTPEPPVGGAGGAVAGGAGGAEAGAGGVPAAIAKSCANECEIDDDCKIEGAIGQSCSPGSHRCYDSTVATCTTNDDCKPGASFWFVTCQSDADCADDNSESCIEFGGVGYCALLSVSDACDVGLGPKDLPRLGAQGTSNVCVAYDTCQSGTCQFSCADPDFGVSCGAGTGDTCNPDSGLCECAAAGECDSGACGADSHCADCKIDDDCPGGISGQDVCVNGKCGCSAANVCPDLTQAATPVCEQ